MSRFDWYAATVPKVDAHQLATDLARELDGSLVVARPHNGYTAALAVEAEGSNVATIYYGGNNGAPHAFASSDHAPRFAEVLRQRFPEHNVTRMDVAVDFDEPGVFERILGTLRELRTELGLSYSMAGAWDDGGSSVDGRTYYLGSRKSAVFLRLYEKGKELRTHELPEGVEPSLDLTRLELVVRPEGESRRVAAVSAPETAWGYAVWAQEVAQRVLALDAERVHIKQPRRSDRDRALQAMCEQYARHMAEYALELGGGEALGLELLRRANRTLARKEHAA
jgi:hypothetical protein